MIAVMRTKAQAQKVADLTGGKVLFDKDKPTRKVTLAGDFEQYRDALESVSVLFSLCDDAGEKAPTRWTITGASFEVEWPRDPQSSFLVRSHFAARRVAYNWALAKVKSDMEAKKKDASFLSTPWTLEALAKQWNQEKSKVAPWWGDNSKEAYASGIADLVRALSNWSSSKCAKAKG